MPRLDVSDAFDPDFMDPLVCKRQTQTVGNNGRAVDAEAQTPFSGVVTNENGDTLQRGSDAARVAATIVVTTPFTLRMAGAGVDADVVAWNGRDYTVASLNDYSTYGAGYVAAKCEVIPIAG